MHEMPEWFGRVQKFEWDEGNHLKNWKKHEVANGEAEEVFFNQPQFFFEDANHSSTEPRFLLLGKTHDERRLAIIFTVRRDRIRVISARDMSRKERGIYEKIR